MAKKKKEPAPSLEVQMSGRKPLLMEDHTTTKVGKQMQASLNATFTLEELRPFADHLRKTFNDYKFYHKDNPDVFFTTLNTLWGGMKQKMDFLTVIGCIFASKHNFLTYYNLLDRDTKNMLEYLFIHIYSSPEQLNTATGVEWVVKSEGRYSYSSKYEKCSRSAACLFYVGRATWGYYFADTPSCMLGKTIWKLYAQYIFPELHEKELASDGLKSLPKNGDTEYVTYSNEAQMGDYLTILQQMLKQKKVEFGDKKMTTAVVKKVAKMLSFKEFLEKPVLKTQTSLAAILGVPILATFISGDTNVIQYWEPLRVAFRRNSMRYVLFDMLGHLKGLRRDYILDNAYYDGFETLLHKVISDLHPKRWYSPDEIMIRLYAIPDVKEEHIRVFSADLIEKYDVSADDVVKLRAEHIHDYVQRPLLYGYLALYASCGLLEIAYDHKGLYHISPYDIIEYVRLTPLGEYVFGITQRYESSEVHQPLEYFSADSDRLIIRALTIDGKNPYEAIITDLADAIGASRYIVTPASFLRGCSTLDDVMKKEQSFMTNICAEPSMVWKEFFGNMKHRCHPLLPTDEQYTVRRIDPANKELQHIFMNDTYIRKHTLRGENHTILIESRFMNKVIERLRTYGYLV